MGYIDKTWYVGSERHKYYPCHTKKSNMQSSVWATLMKRGMWVVRGTSTTHVVCCHQMCIFNTSFAFLF